MLQTLHPEDKMIISNINYQPAYKDIVFLNMPNFTGKPFIKRVIATGGQTVDINYSRAR
jgi:signal peptidase I